MAVTFRRQTLAGEMLVLQLAIVVMVLLAVAAVSLAQSEATFNRVEGRRVGALAEQLAANPLVRSRLVRPVPGEALAALVNSTQTQSGVTSVTVAGPDGRIVASTIPTVIGDRLPPGDGAVHGRGWSGPLTLDGSRERVAQVPVLGANQGNLGHHLGTVMIGAADPTVWQRLSGASSYLLTYLGVASGLGVAGSWLLARRVKRQSLGLEPREIAGLAEHREAMLYGIAEGVIALDPQHRLTLVNETGRRLLALPEDCVGRSLDALGVDGRLRDVLTGTQRAAGGRPPHRAGERPRERDGDRSQAPEAGRARPRADARPSHEAGRRRDEVVVRNGRVLVMNRMTVSKDGRPLGSVTTLRDRTELARLEREIGSFRSSSELLRAQAHEFANQLHTISGLIQIGEQDEVVRYIRALSRRRQSLDVTLSRRVRDTALAALLTAKASLAAERRVSLRISDRTALDRLSPEDAADVATVVGNLVDNAVDAAAATAGGPGAGSGPEGDGHEAWVEVELRQDAASVEIVVRDSGPGVAPELAREVFQHGFTTKAAQEGERGIGLALTRLVCERHGGEISVTNTPEGAMFTARMTVSHLADAVAEGAGR
ncbi:sensor histidine kinase [Streptomyces prasinopilosus]|uniref:histidine kinase n=1 Tax=Streptomyces prasinopilosus TaxID=67344 RepID=A0A1G6S9Y0_9ACTN|nr:ATP-binding protein [Streptomyces prasinopilosus]SDD13553.1 Sensor histidine kinase regulating citrate/malate metabolism [Streptomyces prasinopilosus]